MSGRQFEPSRHGARRMRGHRGMRVVGLGLATAGLLSLLAAGTVGTAGALEPTDPVSQVVPVAGAGNGGGVLVFNSISRNPSCSVTRNLLNQSDVAVVTHVLSSAGVDLDQRALAPGEQTTFVIDHTVVTLPLFIQVDGGPSVELVQVGPVTGCDSPEATVPDTPPVAPPTTAPPTTVPPTSEPPTAAPPTSGPPAIEPPDEPAVPASVPDGEPPAALPPPSTVAAAGTPTSVPPGGAVVAGATTPLPTTGADSRRTALTGLGLLGGGVVLVGAGRRRMAAGRPLG